MRKRFTGRKYDRQRVAAGRYHQRTAQGRFGIGRRNSLKSFKKRVMRKGLTAKNTFKKRFNKVKFGNWKAKNKSYFGGR